MPKGDRRDLQYNWSERKRRAAVVKAWIEQHGHWCPGYHVPAHDVVPPNVLTADHVVPVARGGAEDGPLSALCRSCNSRKRDGRKPPVVNSRAW